MSVAISVRGEFVFPVSAHRQKRDEMHAVQLEDVYSNVSVEVASSTLPITFSAVSGGPCEFLLLY